MSRLPIVAGNWKMNRTVPESIELVGEITSGLGPVSADVEVVVLPPFTSLWPVSGVLGASGIALGAQDVYWEPKGAFTGEVSVQMIAGWCRYALIGHSERRALFGETDDTVNRKVHAALGAGIRAMVAAGETLEQHETGQTEAVLGRQVPAALAGVEPGRGGDIVLAYEPVWAIGTGRTASTEHAQASCALIRRLVASSLGEAVAAGVRVLYGGSVSAGNAAALMACEDVDGALVGGASLVAADFLQIVGAAAGGSSGAG